MSVREAIDSTQQQRDSTLSGKGKRQTDVHCTMHKSRKRGSLCAEL